VARRYRSRTSLPNSDVVIETARVFVSCRYPRLSWVRPRQGALSGPRDCRHLSSLCVLACPKRDQGGTIGGCSPRRRRVFATMVHHAERSSCAPSPLRNRAAARRSKSSNEHPHRDGGSEGTVHVLKRVYGDVIARSSADRVPPPRRSIDSASKSRKLTRGGWLTHTGYYRSRSGGPARNDSESEASPQGRCERLALA
jgi:hypothetical protein